MSDAASGNLTPPCVKSALERWLPLPVHRPQLSYRLPVGLDLRDGFGLTWNPLAFARQAGVRLYEVNCFGYLAGTEYAPIRRL
jgi:hypothetical protein